MYANFRPKTSMVIRREGNERMEGREKVERPKEGEMERERLDRGLSRVPGGRG